MELNTFNLDKIHVVHSMHLNTHTLFSFHYAHISFDLEKEIYKYENIYSLEFSCFLLILNDRFYAFYNYSSEKINKICCNGSTDAG